MKGRGSRDNPTNRFEEVDYVALPEYGIEPPIADEPTIQLGPSGLQTRFYKDLTKTILSKNESPDISFGLSLNPYRGCEHGCIYCYARPTHEYLGLSAGLDFESKIFVKENAPELLSQALAAKNYEPQTIFFSGVTDCYQPAERRFQITRRCLQVLAQARNPVWIVTKNALVTRDIDVLGELARHQACVVTLSITTLDNELCGKLEPRTSRPQKRLEAVRLLSEAGIPVGVNIAPIIPALNEVEIPALLQASKDAGASFAWYTCVRLPFAVKEIFADWLASHFPERRERILSNIRQIRGGKLNDPHFGTRMQGEGLFAERIKSLFKIYQKKHGLDREPPQLSTRDFVKPSRAPAPQPEETQLKLF